MYVARLSTGTRVAHEFGAGRGGYLYLISGAVDANAQPMKTGDAAYVSDAGSLDLAATATSELLLVDTPL
jgi:redox-sensitive bicupin YhaK (pirin superfamily)